LAWGGKPPLAVSSFLEDCRRVLPGEDAQEVEAALGGRGDIVSAKNSVLKQWLESERQRRNELVWLRAAASQKDPRAYARGERYPEPYWAQAVAEAFRSEDPLQGEILLDHFRWRYLNELEHGHYFDLEFLIVYGLKLEMLERHERYRSNKGKEIFAGYKKAELSQYAEA